MSVRSGAQRVRSLRSMSDRLRILLVDSEPNDRALAALVLRRELPDVEIEEAGDAMVLADRLPRGGFAAVITEYRLAWGDGLQVLESVKSLAPDCPVVFFASDGNETVAADGIRRGLAAYLVKGSGGYLDLPGTVLRVIERSAELRASREAAASYRRFTEELALGTFIAGSDGLLTQVSPSMARILGCEKPESLIGRGLAGLLSDEALQAQVLASMARGRAVRGLEAGVRRPDGELTWVRLTAWPVVDAEEGVVRYEGSVEDISGRRQTERELSERAAVLGRSNEELQQFAYVISHDLQEPLQLIARYARMLAIRGSTAADDDATRYLTHLLQCTDRMQAMIDDVLSYARVDTQAKPFTPVDFAEAVRKAMGNLKAVLDESGAQVTWERLPVLAADGAQMIQLFQNLIGNAVKFRRGQPLVQIFAVEEARCCTFAVADNGIGIAPEHLERIFGMFQRLHTAAEYRGTGIGLAICKRIVERHGGRIWAVSEPGQGSTFCFTIPKSLGQASWAGIQEPRG